MPKQWLVTREDGRTWTAVPCDDLRADNERLVKAIEDHRREILFDGESKFDVNEADEKLWRLLTPGASDEEKAT